MGITSIWKMSNVLQKVAKMVIEKNKGYLEDCDSDAIAFLSVTDIRARWWGRTYSVREPFKTLLEREIEYVIVINMDLVNDNFHDSGDRLNAVKLIMLHELRHVLGEGKLRKHNVEDFDSMLRKFGLKYLVSGPPPDIFNKKISKKLSGERSV